MRSHQDNSGRTVNFTRYDPLTILTTPLTESSNPTVCQITASTIAVTLSEYGLTVNTSKLLSLVSIDKNMAEKIALVGQNMGETLNRLVRAQLGEGTAFLPNSATSSTVASTTKLDASAVRGITQRLEINKARPYPDGFWLGKTTPQNKYDLIGDSVWTNAKTYSDVKDLYRGEMGELYQVRWLLNKDVASANGNPASAACTVVMYYSYVHGQDAFGAFDLAGDKPKLYILANQIDSGNPAGRNSKISWAGSYACKILNPDWTLTVKAAAS